MAISVVGSRAGGTNQTTTCTITLNFVTAAGDILFVAFTNGGADTDPSSITGTTTTTGGLTFARINSLGGGASTDMNGWIGWARASGNHTGQTIIGNGFTNSSAGSVLVLRGCLASGNPYAALNQVLNASGTNTLSAVSAAGVAQCWVMVSLHTDDNIASDTMTATDPAAVTLQVEHLSGGGVDTGAAICADAMTGIGSTGAFAWNNGRGAGLYQVALATIVLAQEQPISPVGAAVTITEGSATVEAQAAPVVMRGVTRARIGWTP